MTDQQPTQEQIKEFWGWCGITQTRGRYYSWDFPDGTKGTLPLIGLNNLFKYAVPKVIDKIMAEQECSSDLAYAILFKKWLQKLELDIPNHEGTLFWTIWEVK